MLCIIHLLYFKFTKKLSRYYCDRKTTIGFNDLSQPFQAGQTIVLSQEAFWINTQNDECPK